MFDRILIVCMGNICRSPTAEAVLKKLLPNKHIASAGLIVEKSNLVGKNADETANEVALENGIDISMHKARQLTSELCLEYDLILLMEKAHFKELERIAPEARGKSMLLGHWTENKETPDPYRQDKLAFIHVFKLIEQNAQAWANKL